MSTNAPAASGPAASAATPDASFAALLAQRPFVLFWLARLFGTIANQMLMVAVAWQL